MIIATSLIEKQTLKASTHDEIPTGRRQLQVVIEIEAMEEEKVLTLDSRSRDRGHDHHLYSIKKRL